MADHNISPYLAAARKRIMDDTRKSLLIRFLNSSVVSEYDDVEIWKECHAMASDGLLTEGRLYTGCMSVSLTDKGRAEAFDALQKIPRSSNKPETAKIGDIWIRGGSDWPAGNVTVYTYRDWDVDWPLTNELRAREEKKS